MILTFQRIFRLLSINTQILAVNAKSTPITYINPPIFAHITFHRWNIIAALQIHQLTECKGLLS